MRVIIAGSRTITDLVDVYSALYNSHLDSEITEVVSGTAPGVDRLGEQFALREGIPVVRFPADWDKHGKGAGFIRNAEMAEYADALLAVWDGESRGTKHMINTAYKKGLVVYEHRV